MIWDHNRGLLYHRARTVLADPEAARYVWGAAFHWYTGDHYENVARVHEAFPDKALLFSEGCNYPFSWDTFEQWRWGEKYGEAMINDFNNWACGWTDWNILLDHRGGPNHVKNFCFAPVHADGEGRLKKMKSFYYLGHFSKFIRPGARRLACSSVQDDLLATAFINPDATMVVVVMNKSDKEKATTLRLNQSQARFSLPAHSIATLTW